MGCVCAANANDKYSIENILGSDYENNQNINSKYKVNEYVKKVYFLINKIRTNPPKFAEVVLNYQQFVKEEGQRKIFDYKLKVALNEGKKMFDDCAEYLRNLSPMSELIFNDDIILECPEEPKNIKDINYFKQKVIEKIQQQKIEAYFKDSIKEPEISVLLMIVDDSLKNPRKKREAVLNPNYKFIGISSSTIDETNSNNENSNKENQANGDNGNTANNGNNNNDNGISKKPFCAYFAFK